MFWVLVGIDVVLGFAATAAFLLLLRQRGLIQQGIEALANATHTIELQAECISELKAIAHEQQQIMERIKARSSGASSPWTREPRGYA